LKKNINENERNISKARKIKPHTKRANICKAKI
jgi:hypothetical protein